MVILKRRWNGLGIGRTLNPSDAAQKILVRRGIAVVVDAPPKDTEKGTGKKKK